MIFSLIFIFIYGAYFLVRSRGYCTANVWREWDSILNCIHLCFAGAELLVGQACEQAVTECVRSHSNANA